MTDNTEFIFSHKETIETLLAMNGITKGKWTLVVQFGFSAIAAGPNESELYPTAMVGVTGIGIRRADEETKGIVVDAALLAQVPVGTKKAAPTRGKGLKAAAKK